jgi:hypothetical protein
MQKSTEKLEIFLEHKFLARAEFKLKVENRS